MSKGGGRADDVSFGTKVPTFGDGGFQWQSIIVTRLIGNRNQHQPTPLLGMKSMPSIHHLADRPKEILDAGLIDGGGFECTENLVKFIGWLFGDKGGLRTERDDTT